MNLLKNIRNRADKYESKIAKFLVFYGTIAALLAAMSTISTGVWWMYDLGKDLSTFSKDKKRFERAIKYCYHNIMLSQSVDHEEMDTDTIFGVILQKTDHGDYYYFDTITINGTVRDILYSANIKKKANRDGYHVYIQNMDDRLIWIKPKRKRYNHD